MTPDGSTTPAPVRRFRAPPGGRAPVARRAISLHSATRYISTRRGRVTRKSRSAGGREQRGTHANENRQGPSDRQLQRQVDRRGRPVGRRGIAAAGAVLGAAVVPPAGQAAQARP